MKDLSNASGRGLKDTYLGQRVQDQLVKNEQLLGGPGRRFGLLDAAGMIWNAPRTLQGLGRGLTGYAVGQLARLLPGDQPDPRIRFGPRGVEFINNPAGEPGGGAFGDARIYRDDPYGSGEEEPRRGVKDISQAEDDLAGAKAAYGARAEDDWDEPWRQEVRRLGTRSI